MDWVWFRRRQFLWLLCLLWPLIRIGHKRFTMHRDESGDSRPFRAVGRAGFFDVKTDFPTQYEIEYVRVYQKTTDGK